MKRRINRVEIHNYRQYENVVIDFEQNKNIFAFEGKGGAGKSNFLNAISWCLYGDEPLKSKDDADYLLSTHLRINDEHKNDTVHVQIDITLGGSLVRFVRTRVEKSSVSQQQEKFTTFYMKNNNWVEYANSQYFIDNFLPKSLREFFMFDGENVKSMFRRGYEANIKKNTEVISYIELITKTSEHVSKILIDTRRQLGHEDPNLSGMIDEQNQLTEKTEKTESYILEDRAKLKILEDEKDAYRDKQKTINEFKSLTSRRDTLDRAQESAKKHLENYSADYQSNIGTIAPLVFLYEDLGKFSEALGLLEKSGDLPPKVNPEYVRDLINGKLENCVCGRHIDNEARIYLSTTLNNLDSAQKKSYLLSSNLTLASVKYKLKNSVGELSKIRKNITETEKELSTNELELQDIKRKINDAGGPIGDLQLTIDNTESEITSIKQRIWQEEYDLKQDRERLLLLKRDIALQGDIKNKHEATSKKLELLEFCIQKLNLLGEQNLQRSRRTLSDSMKKYFKELYWKKEYEDVYINDNFEIIIEKGVGDQTTRMPTSQLAGSEGATLGYSLMKGLSELSGFKDSPVFIDGPISDYSEDMQRAFLYSIKDFVPGKQLFVFFKEDTHLVEPYIEENLAFIQAFKIYRDEKADISTIEEWK